MPVPHLGLADTPNQLQFEVRVLQLVVLVPSFRLHLPPVLRAGRAQARAHPLLVLVHDRAQERPE